jgi:hypothetical protein
MPAHLLLKELGFKGLISTYITILIVILSPEVFFSSVKVFNQHFTFTFTRASFLST